MTPATTPSVAPPRSTGALELTLDPISPEVFQDEYREMQPLVVPRAQPGRFDAILAAADVERMVCATAIRAPAFRLVKDGAQLPLGSYTQDIPWRPGGFWQTALVDRVAQEHAAGATIVLQALHLHWRPAALYCRELEARLGCPAQANAYCTPASAQGFAVHHDTHDVFVLQVTGHKRWKLYEPVRELPLRNQRWSPDLDAVGEPIADITLQAGDTLYLPRGWPHEATAADVDSLHVTVGLPPPTRMDALRAALDECGEDVEFRRSLAPDGDLPAHLLERLAARLRPDDVARRARRRFVAGRRAVADDQLSQVRSLESLDADSPLERRATVIADLEETEAGATLLFEGKDVRFPAQAREALAAVHAADGPFTAASLPGSLDEPGRLVLVRRLVREGYLRRP